MIQAGQLKDQAGFTGSGNSAKEDGIYRHRRWALLLVCLGLTGATYAAEPGETSLDSFKRSHQIGVRLGGWANLGDNPPVRDTADLFETSFHDASFLFEGFYAHRFTPALMGEFSLGIVNRGSVSFRIGDRENVGNVLLYSVLLQGKLYPLASTSWGIQPYVTGGGGIFYGRRTVQFSSSIDYFYYPGLDEESATDFNFAVGGGFDWPIATQIGLDFNVKYLPISFGEPLMTVEDYGALAISLGIKYFHFGSTKESDHNRRMR